MLVVLIPTIFTTLVGIALLIFGGGTTALVAGILVLTMCTTGITGYILVSVFVGKGASLVRMQNDFLSSVSHELRTPLTSMRLLMESLRGGRLDPGEQEKVVVAPVARDRPPRRAGPARPRAVADGDPAPPVPSAPWSRSPTWSATRSRRSTPRPCLARPRSRSRSSPTSTMLGDRATLARAIANLLTNAWKYTGDDKRIAVTAARRRPPRRDHGPRQRHRHRARPSSATSSRSSTGRRARSRAAPRASASASRSSAPSPAPTAARSR